MKLINFVVVPFFIANVAMANVDSNHSQQTVNFSPSIVKGNVVVSGVLNANHAKVDGNLEINSAKATIKGSVIKGSVIVKSAQTAPEINLMCTTHVFGNIIFEGQPGIVRKSIDSVIDGKVTNGKIVPSTSNVKCK